MESLTVCTLPLVHLPRKPVWARLGFREGITDPSGVLPQDTLLVERFIAETQVGLVYTKRPYRLDGETCEIAGYRFVSRLVRERFGAALEVLLMAAWARPEDVARLRSLQESGDLRQAVVLDAVLSEKTDFGLDFIGQEEAQARRPRGETLGKRISCGYGDFSLEHQKFFYNTLGLAAHGIRLNDRNILEPEKTVTGLLPIFSGRYADA
jgi:hypothetical protein